jgi:RNA polymerase sigma factor (sigma-70 family)
VEASALPPSVALARTRLALGAPLLRLRSDAQLVSLFRGGNDEAFRTIHDRYRQRMFAYTRQMLSGSAVDAEDAVQEIFVRAYSGLRSSDRELALRAWLYRIAHNRCIDELRRPQSVATETIPATVANTGADPVDRLEQRDALKRLIADVQRLPDQQRSALLMRELAGMTYADVGGALGVSVPAVKSLLVRARVGLAQASEARDTACSQIREDLIVAHDRGVRASGLARRHLRDCPHCRQFRSEVRGVSRQLAAFVPALGPIGVIAKVLGIGGGGGAAAGSTAIAGGGATAATTGAAGGLAGSGAVAGIGALAGTGHVVTLLAAAVVTAGGAIELQHIAPPPPQRVHHHRAVARTPAASPQPGTRSTGAGPASSSSVSQTAAATPATSSAAPASSTASNPLASTGSSTRTSHRRSRSAARNPTFGIPLTERLDPDQLSTLYPTGTSSVLDPTDPTATPVTSTPASTTSADGTPGATPTDPGAPGSTAGTSSATPAGTVPTSVTSTGSTPTTGTSTPSSGTSATGTSAPSTTGTSSSGTGSSSGDTGSTSSTGGSGKTTKVVPAASTGSINPAKTPAASRPHGHGTIAVFTMTGN